MKLSINEILKLEGKVDILGSGIEYELIQAITGFSAGDWFTHDRMVIKGYMNDLCNDSRSREVDIIFLDEIPVVLYQYTGRGSYENIYVIDKEKIEDLKSLIISEYLKEQETSIKEINLDEQIEISLYGANKCYIGNNKLFSNYIKG